MAKDEYFLNKVVDNTYDKVFRLYNWSYGAITIGYFQKSLVFNIEKINDLKIPFIRRLTGGQALYHHKNPSFSIISKRSTEDSTLKKVYQNNIQIISNILNNYGISTIVQEKSTNYTVNPDCTKSISQYESITNDNNKITGIAIKLYKNAYLIQGSFFFKKDSINSFLKNDQFTTITDTNNNEIDYIPDKLRDCFQTSINIKKHYQTNEKENKHITILTEKYKDNQWKFKR